MNNPLRTADDYELFIYEIKERFPSVRHSGGEFLIPPNHKQDRRGNDFRGGLSFQIHFPLKQPGRTYRLGEM